MTDHGATAGPPATASPRLFVGGALTFGFGLGGLADGIVLHQVLQWHNLVSARVRLLFAAIGWVLLRTRGQVGPRPAAQASPSDGDR